jgi:peroxiredoxin
MVWLQQVTILGALVASALASAPCLAEAPSVEIVLKICAENRAKLDPLHLQATYTEERTEAYAKSQANQIPQLVLALSALHQDARQPFVERQLSAIGLTLPQFRDELQQQLEITRDLAKRYSSTRQYEFFVDGEDYQLRMPADSRVDKWTFPDAPLMAESLLTSYAESRVYSRSAHRSPPAQIWTGPPSGGSGYPMITSKHAGETHSMRFPAFMQVMHPQLGLTSPIDVFFSAPANRYRVVGEETKEGRLLTIVDVQVPTGVKATRTGPDGESEEFDQALWCRGWLDLERGGIPVLLQTWYGAEGKPFEEHYRSSPKSVTTTTRIEQLASGGYYPAHTVEEHFNTDPTLPKLSETEWREVQKGTRPMPPQVCFERYTWECTLAESQFKHTADFFALDLPPGGKLFDLDTGKVVGALDVSPPIAVGKLAPEWQFERWLDDKSRKIEDFRGRVVVLQFWNRASTNGLAELAALAEAQKKFPDKSLVVVAIHTADSDVAAVAEQIEKIASEHDWKFLHAIDRGSMYENSETRCAYGVDSTPARIVIDASGKVVANSAIPPAEIADIMGKSCDEVTPGDEARFTNYYKRHFSEAGVAFWSDGEALAEAEQLERFRQVNTFYLTREIEAALKVK